MCCSWKFWGKHEAGRKGARWKRWFTVFGLGIQISAALFWHKKCNAWFQKISITSPRMVFYLEPPPPHPSGNSSVASYFLLKILAFETPHPLRIRYHAALHNLYFQWTLASRCSIVFRARVHCCVCSIVFSANQRRPCKSYIPPPWNLHWLSMGWVQIFSATTQLLSRKIDSFVDHFYLQSTTT